MAVDISDLVEVLKREVAVPGQEELLFPTADDESFVGFLEDAFWEARLDGMLSQYTDVDGIITPVITGADDMSRELQQLIVLYAGIRIMRNELREMNTLFRVVAGPAQYEVGKSAQLLVGILNDLQQRRKLVLVRLSDLGAVPSYYIDAVEARDQSIRSGLTYFVS